MAGSRLEKFGTVFTRVRDLMRSGVVKQKDKPIWYDVYAAFPPKKEPLYVKPQTKKYGKVARTVPDIFYKEDAVRAKFYEAYGNGPKAFDLSRPNYVSTCQRFVVKYQELEAEGQLEEEALFEGAGKALLSEGVILRRRGGAMMAPETRNPVLDMKLKDMLAEQQADILDDMQTETQALQTEAEIERETQPTQMEKETMEMQPTEIERETQPTQMEKETMEMQPTEIERETQTLQMEKETMEMQPAEMETQKEMQSTETQTEIETQPKQTELQSTEIDRETQREMKTMETQAEPQSTEIDRKTQT